MQELDVKLKAKNSSGEQTLALCTEYGELWFVLYGMYNKSMLQIDFNEMTIDELKQLRDMMDIIIEEVDT